MAEEEAGAAEEQEDTGDGPAERGGEEGRRSKQRVVTYEAADRGAVCCLGCQAWFLILAGIALGVWYAYTRELWQIITGLILLVGGLALQRYITSGRNRWEVSFDRDRKVVTLLTQVKGTRERREIPFEEIAAVVLLEISRDVSTGDDVVHYLPVFRLNSGERVELDYRLSVKDPERAQEVLDEMQSLLGLGAQDTASGETE